MLNVFQYHVDFNKLRVFRLHPSMFSCAHRLSNLNSPSPGAAARVIRACLWLRAVRRQRGGGDRHVAPSGAAFISSVCSLSGQMASLGVEVTVCVCCCRWRRACWTLGSLTAWWVWPRSSHSSRPRLPWRTWTPSLKASGIFDYSRLSRSRIVRFDPQV